MIRIEIDSLNVQEYQGTSGTTGKPYHIRKQEGYAFTRDKAGNVAKYPQRFSLMLDDKQAPYAPGEYVLDPSSVYVDQNGRMAIRPRLAPVKKPAAATN